MPDSLHTVAEVVEDVAALNAAACGKEAADNTGDVLADVERLRVIDTDTLHTEAETAYAREHYCLSFSKPVLQNILQLRYHAYDGTLGNTAVTTCLCRDFIEGDLTLTHCLGKIFPIRTAALNIVLD